MPLPIALARAPEALGRFIARVRRWTPLEKDVTILVEGSDDPYVVGRDLHGTVRGFDDESGALLIQLRALLSRRAGEAFVDLLIAAPILRWHGPARLLVTYTAVRLIDAPSFVDLDNARVIGVGRLVLRSGQV
ncbi:MAG TPA: hypothetical protein VGF28_09175 [Thermoanaerobaculia bacterium]|jgi:hypothetical protein